MFQTVETLILNLNKLFIFPIRHSRPLFLYFVLFYTVYLNQLIVNKNANDRIRTSYLWCRRQSLCRHAICATTTAQYLQYLIHDFLRTPVTLKSKISRNSKCPRFKERNFLFERTELCQGQDGFGGNSVTRFGEIYPLWLILKSLAFLVRLFSIGQSFESTLAHF